MVNGVGMAHVAAQRLADALPENQKKSAALRFDGAFKGKIENHQLRYCAVFIFGALSYR